MAIKHWRRALGAAACLGAALLAACGGGEVASQLAPKRVVAFGGAFGDVGNKGSRYTINDGSINVWSEELASRYGLALTPSKTGGTGYATGSARVAAVPDAAGDASTPTVAAQIDDYLASGSFNADDLVLVSGGVSDIVAEVGQTQSGAQSADQARADLIQAAKQLADQVRRLVNAGASHVVVVGPYNLGRTPWALSTGQQALLENYSVLFNDQLKIAIADLGAHVLYVDAAYYYNLVTGTPSGYSLSNVTDPACTSVGSSAGIGAGAIDSTQCDPSTLQPGIDPAQYLWADALYPTPVGQRLFGDYAFDRIRARW